MFGFNGDVTGGKESPSLNRRDIVGNLLGTPFSTERDPESKHPQTANAAIINHWKRAPPAFVAISKGGLFGDTMLQ